MEAIILLMVGIFVIGPDRAPRYAEKLAQLIKQSRVIVTQAQEQLNKEIGEDIEWEKLDPRKYNLKHVIKNAIVENFSDLDAHDELKQLKHDINNIGPIRRYPSREETTGREETLKAATTTTMNSFCQANKSDAPTVAETVPFDIDAT